MAQMAPKTPSGLGKRPIQDSPQFQPDQQAYYEARDAEHSWAAYSNEPSSPDFDSSMQHINPVAVSDAPMSPKKYLSQSYSPGNLYAGTYPGDDTISNPQAYNTADQGLGLGHIKKYGQSSLLDDKHNIPTPEDVLDIQQYDHAQPPRKRQRMSRLTKGEAGKQNSPIEDEQRQRFLEKNRLAASKCRAKKKQWTEQLEEKCRLLKSEHDSLAMYAMQLTHDVMGLKEELLRHVNCGCESISGYLRSQAAFIAASTTHNSVVSLSEGESMLSRSPSQARTPSLVKPMVDSETAPFDLKVDEVGLHIQRDNVDISNSHDNPSVGIAPIDFDGLVFFS
ncbi:MAG: hypothetical protein M1834_008764 [Cirrosporium novae-zelandiae]|nr:MAG: hypothetical protein M1834_008764 [Cirrosporium novae-zelandiae]